MISKIRQAIAVKGSITVPGDKSISHRALLLGASAEGKTQVYHLSSSADVKSTLTCLKQLGVSTIEDNDTIEILGKGLYGLKAPSGPLDCGNSGTTMRLLSGILAAQPFTSILVGDESLSKRPMKRIIEPLARMGAKIECQPGGLAPLTIHGNQLRPILYPSPVASAQVKSCLLLGGLYAHGETTIVEPYLSRDHTERMLNHFGVPVKRQHLAVGVSGPANLQGCVIHVPGDFSSAAFFIGAALITPNSKLIIANIGINPTRIGLLDILKQMGAKIEICHYNFKSAEPIGEITAYTSQLKGVDIPPELVPKLIDEVPVLAVVATQAKGTTRLSGARELRVKESDRLRATAKNLALMGAKIQEQEDGFIIEGSHRLKGATVNSYGDHRIAMAFSIAGLAAEGETHIENAECVEISMPNFFETLQGIVVE